MPFAIVEAFESDLLGLDLGALAPGRPAVVESVARLRRQPSYGFVRAAVLLALADGRTALSVPPGAGEAAERVLAEGEDLLGDAFAAALTAAVEPALHAAGLGRIKRHFADRVFACGAAELRRHRHGDLRRLRDESVPPVPELALPTHCFPDGTAYGIVENDRVVSVAYAHRIGAYEDRLADLGVITAYAWRRMGYAQSVVSAVAGEVIDRGGEARYGCQVENQGSVATALSCGFRDWACSLVLAAEAPDD